MAMKVHYMSDIHLEFGVLEDMPEGKVLVLAGDITVAACLAPEVEDPRRARVRSATLRFFDVARKNFDLIIYVGGNHEPYGLDIDQSQVLIEEHLCGDGILYLENKAATIEGVTFLGSTLWTDMECGEGLSDFYVISADGRRFTPRHAVACHQQSLGFLKCELAGLADHKVVVVTHHAPSYQGMTDLFLRTLVAPAFSSDLDNFISAHPQI